MATHSPSAGASATVAFVDIAGFSAIADVHGDASAIAILEVFEAMVREALSGYEPPIKWIGDEAMLAFPEPQTAIEALGREASGLGKGGYSRTVLYQIKAFRRRDFCPLDADNKQILRRRT